MVKSKTASLTTAIAWFPKPETLKPKARERASGVGAPVHCTPVSKPCRENVTSIKKLLLGHPNDIGTLMNTDTILGVP